MREKSKILPVVLTMVLMLSLQIKLLYAIDDAIESTLSGLYSQKSDYEVKKHIKNAINCHQKNLSKCFEDEINILKIIDKDSTDIYENIMKPDQAETQRSLAISIPVTPTAVSTYTDKNLDLIIEKKFIKAQEAYKKSDLEKAKAILIEILEIDKENQQSKAFLKEIQDETFILDEDKPFQSIVKQLYDEGMKFFRKELYKEADGKLKEAHETDPTNEQVNKWIQIVAEKSSMAKDIEEKNSLLLTADKMRASGEIKEARETYGKVLKISPDDRQAQFYMDSFNKKSVELIDEAEKLYDAGQTEESYKMVKTALEYNGDNIDAQNLEKKLNAEIAGTQNMEKEKKKADELYNKGVDAYGKGEYEKSIEYWQEVIHINPGDAGAKKNIKTAQEKINEVIEKSGKKIEGILAEGKEFFEQGLVDKAKGRFEYVLRVDPDNATAEAYMGKINEIIEKSENGEIIKR